MKPKKFSSVPCLLFVLFTVLPVVLTADTAETGKLPPEALALFNKGMVAVDQKEWLIAIRYFSEAQGKASAAPEILLNLALAESKVPGRELRALVWFHAYLAAAPTATNAAAVRDQCANLEIRIEARVARLVDQAKTMASAFPENNGRSATLRDVAMMQARTGDISGAKQLASTLSGTDEWLMKSEAYAAIAQAELAAGKPDDAKITAIMISNKDEGDLAGIAGGLAQAGDIAGAKAIAARIGDTDGPSACDAIAIAEVRAGDIEAAKKTLQSAKGRYRGYTGWIAVANAQAKAGRIDEARATLVHARDTVDPNGVGPMFDYQAVGEAQAALGDLEGARKTATMITGTDGPSVSCRNWIGDAIGNYYVQSCQDAVKKGDLKAAAEAVALAKGNPRQKHVQEVLDNALLEVVRTKVKAKDFTGAMAVAESIVSTYPGINAYQELIRSGYLADRLATGDWQGAVRLAEHAPADEKTDLFLALAKAYLRADDPAKAQACLAKARAAVETLTGYSKSNAIGNIAYAQIEMKDLAGAKETAALLVSATDDSNAASGRRNIAQKLVAAGDIPGALALANGIVYKDSSYKDAVFSDIAKAQASGADLTAALATASKIEKAEAKAETYKDIADTLGSCGKFEEARQVIDLITPDLVKAKAYESLASNLLYRSRLAESREAFAKAQSLLDKLQDPELRIDNYLSLEDSYNYYYHDATVARSLIAKANALVPRIDDPVKRSSSHLQIASAQIRVGQLAEARESVWFAIEAAGQMKEENYKNSRRWDIARILLETGDFPGAREIANQISDRDTRDYVLCEIAEKFIACGNLKSAAPILNEIGTQDKKERVSAQIALKQAGQGDLAAARKTAKGITSNTSAKSTAWSAIVGADLKANDRASAKIDANESPDLDYGVITALIETGEIGWGLEKLQANYNNWYSRNILEAIAAAQAKAGDIAGARKTAAMSIYITDQQDILAQIAAVQAKEGDIPGAKTTAAAITKVAYKSGVSQVLADQGETAWALEYSADIPGPSTQLAIAQTQIKLGDKTGAVKTLHNLKEKCKSASELESCAITLAQAGETDEAKAVMTSINGTDFNFDGWLGYQTVDKLAPYYYYAKKDFAAASKAAAGISDAYWKSKAYEQLAEAGFDQPQVRDWLAAITDPGQKSGAAAYVIDSLLSAERVSDAAAIADLIPDDNLKITAISKITATAIAKDDVSAVLAKILALPDSAGKTVILVNILCSSAEGFDRAKVVAAAVQSANAMPDSIAKAMAFADIGKAAASAVDAKTSDDIQKTWQALTSNFTRADQARWAIYTNLRVGEPVPIPTQEDRQAAAALKSALENRVRDWTYLVNYPLKEELFTDPQAYIQSLQTKTEPYQIFNGIVGAGYRIAEQSHAIKKLEADQAKAAAAKRP